MAKASKQRTIVEVNVPELDGIVDSAEDRTLNADERTKLKTAIHALVDQLGSDFLVTEKMKKILPPREEDAGSEEQPEKKKAPGHGRNKPAMFTGANKHKIAHGELKPGCTCPECHEGKVYAKKNGKTIVRLIARMPVQGDVYDLESLRCNRCGQVFVAKEPDGVGPEKYDESVGAMVAMLHYGAGMPFNRLEALQAQVGVPLPASDQWELVQEAADLLAPVHEELTRQAAQAELVQNDDTGVTILKQNRPAESTRTGTFTTGLVATTSEKHKIALFMSGPQHAGENLGAVLRQRAGELDQVLLMSDALTRNVPKNLGEGVQILWANCMDHGRRYFVKAVDGFPEECRYVLEMLGKVYAVDKQTRGMAAKERLLLHKSESGPVLKELRKWMLDQQNKKKTEPNSKLGKAIAYMINHWDALTLFLRQPGAPLNNSIVERALKKAILLRKNSLFYRTAKGAEVGDLFLSLIHTCELNNTNAFDYLLALLRHPVELRQNPTAWTPWTYLTTQMSIDAPASAVPSD